MFLTSLLLVAAALVLVIWGAIKGSVLLLGISLGCGAAGAVALLVANAVAPRLAKAAGMTADGPTPDTSSTGAGAVAVDLTERSVGGSPVPLAAWAVADAPPIPGYDEMTAAQVVRLVGTGALAKPALAALLAYEAGHQGRTTVVTSLERALGVKAGAR
jgi:hypothetical protein